MRFSKCLTCHTPITWGAKHCMRHRFHGEPKPARKTRRQEREEYLERMAAVEAFIKATNLPQ